MQRPQPIVCACGSAVVSWDPVSTASQKKTFELPHNGKVASYGWINSRALATGGAECVVNVYNMEDRLKAATVPHPKDLPPDCSPITSLAVLHRGCVACGHEDGSVIAYHLTGKQVWADLPSHTPSQTEPKSGYICNSETC